MFKSRSYCVISCGGAPLSVIKQHIKQQAAKCYSRATAYTTS